MAVAASTARAEKRINDNRKAAELVASFIRAVDAENDIVEKQAEDEEEIEPIDMIASGREDTGGQDDITVTPSQDRLDQMKVQHDLAKAVKSDDAEVPIHLWDSV